MILILYMPLVPLLRALILRDPESTLGVWSIKLGKTKKTQAHSLMDNKLFPLVYKVFPMRSSQFGD